MMIIFLIEYLPCVRHSMWFLNLNSFGFKLLVEMKGIKTQLEKQMPGDIKATMLVFMVLFFETLSLFYVFPQFFSAM